MREDDMPSQTESYRLAELVNRLVLGSKGSDCCYMLLLTSFGTLVLGLRFQILLEREKQFQVLDLPLAVSHIARVM